MGRSLGWLKRWFLLPGLMLGSATLIQCGGPGPRPLDQSGGQTGAGGSGGTFGDLGSGGDIIFDGTFDTSDGAGGLASGGQGAGGFVGSGGSVGSGGASGGDGGGAGEQGSGGADGSGGGASASGGTGSGGVVGSGGQPATFECPSGSASATGEGGYGGSGTECAEGREWDALAEDCVVPIVCNESGSPFGGGDGSEHDPFLICSIEQLRAIGTAADGMSFVLAKSLDLSTVTALTPLTPSFHPFEGTLCGAGRVLVGAALSFPNQDTVGLFGVLGQTALVANLRLVDFQVIGNDVVGMLAGKNEGTLSEVEASGTVLGHDFVGGLVGGNIYGDILSCETNGSVLGNLLVGGLVGQNLGPIVDSRSSATVEGAYIAGGLAGLNAGLVERSQANGEVWGENFDIGGLVGVNDGTVSESRATGDVDGSGSVGGLIGSAQIWVTTADSMASGNVTGDVNVGGLIGSTLKGTVVNCGATGDVTAFGNVLGTGNAGGLIGTNQAAIEACFATGSVSSAKGAGGLVGVHEDWFINRIKDSYAIGNVDGDGEVGGLIGELVLSVDPGGNVQTSYALGVVSGGDPKAGLIGAMPPGYPVGYCFYLDQPPNSGPGTPLSLAAFADAATFAWSIGSPGSPWIMSEALGRPILAWELE